MIPLRECLMAVHGTIGTYATIANRCQISPSENFLGKQPLDAMFFESALGTPHEKVECFLMRMIGFSARALARGDYRQALKMLADKENMDKRKPIGQMAADLAKIFDLLPRASFRFDIGMPDK
jgi:hypothetical protein